MKSNIQKYRKEILINKMGALKSIEIYFLERYMLKRNRKETLIKKWNREELFITLSGTN